MTIIFQKFTLLNHQTEKDLKINKHVLETRTLDLNHRQQKAEKDKNIKLMQKTIIINRKKKIRDYSQRSIF